MESRLVIQQGTTWGRAWPLTDPATGLPLDLTGWTVRSQVRPEVTSATVLHQWTSPTNASADAEGWVSISVDPEVSSTWEWTWGVYDIEAVSPTGQVVRVAEGHVLVKPEVTR